MCTEHTMAKRVVSFILSTILVGQAFIYGDGMSQGLLHAETLNDISNSIKKQQQEKILANEFEKATQGLSQVEYFDYDNNELSMLSLSNDASKNIPNTLTIQGYVSLATIQIENLRNNQKIKVIIFNDSWETIGEAVISPNQYFEVSVDTSNTSTTHVKIECDGYLPRFYKDMGHGGYQLGTESNPEILLPGDTKYNKDNSNQWSDEVIDANDVNFVGEQLGKRQRSENYYEQYDVNGDNIIDSLDGDIIRNYAGHTIVDGNLYDTNGNQIFGGEFIIAMDFDNSGVIDENDWNYIYDNYQTPAYKGNEDFDEYSYLDINNNDIIDDYDYLYYNKCCELYDGYNPYNDYIYNLTLVSDTYHNGAMYLENTNLDLNGHLLCVNGNLVFRTSNPNHTMWNDNPGVTLDTDGGTLYIAEQFDFGQANSYDKIIMTNEDSELYIFGNWNYITLTDMEGLWTAGTIYFCGPTWQVNEASGDKSVYSTGTHSIWFFYEYGKQTILWDNQKELIYDPVTGEFNTNRWLNFGYIDEETGECLGVYFPYGYSSDRYWFRPWFPNNDEVEPDYTLYRRGWEMGDGIHIATGNYTKSFVDMSTKMPGMTIDFVRTYNSTSKEEGSFGIGWDFNIDVSKILIPEEGYYQVVLPDGSNSTFKETNGNFQCENNHNTMVHYGDGYLVTLPSQIKYYFNADKNLYRIVDTDGNEISISDIDVSSENKRTITDSVGQQYYVYYSSNDEHKRVQKIVDPNANREVIYYYDENNQLQSATSILNAIETYSYDENLHMNNITNTFGETKEYIVYYTDGKVNTITNSNGLKQEYVYNRLFKQTGVKEYDNDTLIKTIDYDYDEKYAVKTNTVHTDNHTYEIEKATYKMVDGKNKYDEVISYVDDKGNKTETIYDDNGNITQTTLPDGSITYVRYNTQNSQTVSVDANGNATINEYDNNGTRIIRMAKTLSPVIDIVSAFPESGFNPTDYINNNISNLAVTSYEYYADSEQSRIFGLIRSITDPEGNVTEYVYNDNGTVQQMFQYGGNKTKSNCTSYEYNALGLATKTTTPEGFVTEVEYNADGSVTNTYVYGKPNADGSYNSPAVIKIEYDELGRKIKEISPNYADDNSHYTSYTYYPSDAIKTQTDAEGNQTSYIYNGYGNVICVTNPNGTQNLTEYDGLGREIKTSFRNKNGNSLILTTTSYEVINNYPFVHYTSVNSAPVNASHNAYSIIKTQFISTNKEVVTEVITDCNGNTVVEKTNGEVKRTNEYYANGQLGSQTDALGNTTKYAYDYLNLVTETYTPFNINENGTTNYAITKNIYDKNGKFKIVESTSQEQSSSTKTWNKSEFWYDCFGNTVQVAMYNSNGENTYTQYIYDNDSIKLESYAGMTSPDDTEKLTTQYIYDNRNQLIRTIDSTGYNSGTINYDLSGNIISNTDANGNITTKTYDALNRILTSETIGNGSVQNTNISYTYDCMGNVTNVVNNDTTTLFTYDELNRLSTEISYTTDPQNASFKGYFYVGSSEQKAESIIGVNHILMYSNTYYEYDNEMRLSKVVEGNTVTAYTYDANGNKSKVSYSNGVSTTYSYNLSNMITSLINKKDNNILSQYDYSYYLNGSDSCKIRTESGIIETTSYEYDDLGRLVTETETIGDNVNTMSYSYDRYSNRSQMIVTGEENYTTTYDYTSNGNYTGLLQKETKVTGDVTQETTYTYDANGNQITKNDPDEGLQTNTYDGINQLVEVQNGENTASYTYNYDGLRNSKTVNGVITNQIWDGKQIVADVQETYHADVYIRGTGLIATFKFGTDVDSIPTYYLQNAHGDVVNLVSDTGEKIKTYHYDAFGVEKNMVDEDTNPFRYCGEYFDKETNTIYLRARYYDASIGRFISRDTNVGKDTDPLSLNLYTYCRNNPVIFTDESGHVFNLAAAGVGALIGAAINVGVMAIGDAISGETHSTSEYVATAVSGAIGGLAAGFTLGGSVAAQIAGEVAIDAGLGAISSVAEQAIVDKEVNWSEVGMSALSSGLSTGVNIGARRAVSNITPFCMGGAASKGCFVAGTLVETIDGDKPIENIQIGDFVLSSDPETGKTAYKEVVNTYIHVKDTLVYVTINGETIETTEEHPFWVEGNGWIKAKNLNNNDVVRDKNGNNLIIENVQIVKLPENEYVAVYNFEVVEYHTYFVSDYDILVHNKCDDVTINNSNNKQNTLIDGIPVHPNKVRRFMSKKEFKDFKKNGFVYDPSDSRGGISATSLIEPKNPQAIKNSTGALGADYYIDIDVTNKNVMLKGKTKGNLPDWKIQSNVSFQEIIDYGKVRK